LTGELELEAAKGDDGASVDDDAVGNGLRMAPSQKVYNLPEAPKSLNDSQSPS
jgi:hypothetical protein